MKKILFTIQLLLIGFAFLLAQGNFNYVVGESLSYTTSYSVFDVAHTNVKFTEKSLNGKSYYHIESVTKNASFLNLICKIDSKYETYLNKETFKPFFSIVDVNDCKRKIDESNFFDYKNKKVKIIDYKENNKESMVAISENTQEFISSFYNFRNLDLRKYKSGDYIQNKVFVNRENIPFKIQILAREVLKTNFGRINTIKMKGFPPEKGDIFDGNEEIIFWISDDKNAIALKTEIEFSYGKIVIALDNYKNLKYPFNFHKKL